MRETSDSPTRQIDMSVLGAATRSGNAGERNLLIYVHVPFCNSKCTFCDWVSPISVRQLRSNAQVREDYTRAVAAQIRAAGPLLSQQGYVPRLIYWGGGTPSKLEADQYEHILTALREVFDLSRVVEHTTEASPETLTMSKLERLREVGVDRISIGAQSMQDAELRAIGRAHLSAHVVDAFSMARDAGIANVNLDFIVGFPGQHLDSVIDSLSRAIALGPEHVTVYVYRPSPGTVMAAQVSEGHRQRGSLKEMLDLYIAAQILLQEAGYEEYSFGYFARAGRSCKAESYYFGLEGDYIGFGSGARSIVGHRMLESSSTDLHGFIAHPEAFDRAVPFSARTLDAILPSLRLAMFDGGGIDYRRFERLFGFAFEEILRDPLVTGLLDYLRLCGTQFVKTDERLAVTRESRARGYIMSMLRAFEPLKSNASKLTDAFQYVALVQAK